MHIISLFYEKNRPVILGIAITGLVSVFLLLSSKYSELPVFHKKSLAEFAGEIMASCAKERYRTVCYDRAIPQVTDSLTMEEAFAVVRIVQEKDGAYWYCHVVSHELSEKETKKDLGKWKDVVARCSVGMCSNGCIHGAFQERFRAESLSPEKFTAFRDEITDVCENRKNWPPNGLEQFSCYHALGHLLMYATGADITNAIHICKDIGQKNKRSNFIQSCYDGAFMQIFQPLEPEDVALVAHIKPTKAELPVFCNKFGKQGPVITSCWSEGWPLFFDKILEPKKAADFCLFLSEGSDRDRCYIGIFFAMAVHVNFDENKIANFCNGIYPEVRGRCFSGAAFRLMETDVRLSKKAVALCARAVSATTQNECLGLLLSRAGFTFHPGTDELRLFCASLPENWSLKCKERYNKY